MKARLTGINENEVLSYLGYKGGELPGRVINDIRLAGERIIKEASPRVVYKIFTREANGDIFGLGFELLGEDVKRLLAESHHVVLFAATLGAEIDMLLRREQVVDMSRALVLDACANSAVENVCDNFCKHFSRSHGWLTDRFSPGYGDMPLHQQRGFASVLDVQKAIGVTLTDSGMLVPMKSVTAVFGIAEREQKKRFSGCESCNKFHECAYRKENKSCGKV